MSNYLNFSTGAAPSAHDPVPHAIRPLRPSVAIIAGVLATVFALTFLLLLYAKHCLRHDAGGGTVASSSSSVTYGQPYYRSGLRDSGVNRAVVESLPLFRFGSLTGDKAAGGGLECAVCLAPFAAEEALRLLPSCRHAFHVDCVDTWLDAHASCPLCRCRVRPEDVLLLPPPAAAPPLPPGRRISGRHSSAGERSSKWLLKIGVDPVRGRKDRMLLPTEVGGGDEQRRFSHRIVVSGSSGGGGGDEVGAAPERWSELRPSDLLFLRSEMIITGSGR